MINIKPNGYAEIQKFLIENHVDGEDLYSDKADWENIPSIHDPLYPYSIYARVEYWADLATESHYNNGDGPSIELKSRESADGVTTTFDLELDEHYEEVFYDEANYFIPLPLARV